MFQRKRNSLAFRRISSRLSPWTVNQFNCFFFCSTPNWNVNLNCLFVCLQRFPFYKYFLIWFSLSLHSNRRLIYIFSRNGEIRLIVPRPTKKHKKIEWNNKAPLFISMKLGNNSTAQHIPVTKSHELWKIHTLLIGSNVTVSLIVFGAWKLKNELYSVWKHKNNRWKHDNIFNKICASI